VAVLDADGDQSILPAAYLYVAGVSFKRGDANRDGRLDIADAIAALGYLFSSGALPCLDAADANDDGKLDVSDAVYLLAHLYAGGAPPPPPFPGPGDDRTPDALTCEG
jgi:hypothetical protein